MERDKIEELLEDVDTQWKNIQTLMTKSSVSQVVKEFFEDMLLENRGQVIL